MSRPSYLKRVLAAWRSGLTCLLCLCAASAAWAAAKPASPAAPAGKVAAVVPPEPVKIPESSFTYEPGKRGKDPFHPNLPPPTAPPATKDGLARPATPPAESLVLKGVALVPNMPRMVRINNQNFTEGTELVVTTTEGAKVTVKCVQIGYGYAVVSVDGGPPVRLEMKSLKKK